MSTVVAAFSVDTRDMNLASRGESPSDFQFTLKTSINLDNGKHYDIALARGLIFYAWNNLTVGLLPIDFSFNGNIMALDTGNYSLLTLEAKIKEKLENFGGLNPDDFEMRKDYPSGKIVITLLNAATFTPISVEFSKMIGFAPGVGLTPTDNYGDFLPDFEGENTRIFLLNSLVATENTFVNQSIRDYLYEIKAPEKPAYTLFNVIDTPESFIWLPINTTNIFNMHLRLVNQDNQTVDLNGTQVKYWMVIRERPHNTVRVEGAHSDRPVRF